MKKQFWTYVPESSVGQLVKYLWLWKTDGELESRIPDRFIPNGHFELLFDLKDNFEQLNKQGHWEKAPSSFIAGMYTKHFFVKHGQEVFRVGVIVRPGMIQHIIREDIMHIKGRNIALEDVLGNSIKSFRDQLYSLNSPICIFKALENFLFDIIKYDQRNLTMEWVVNKMMKSNGNLSVKQLAQEVHMCERQFRRKFRNGMGVSPKQYMKLIRVANTTKKIFRCQHQKLSDIAYDAGFADQSHLIREFKSIAGINPKAYLREPHPITEQLILTL